MSVFSTGLSRAIRSVSGPLLGLVAIAGMSVAAPAATVTPVKYYPAYAVTSDYNIGSIAISGHGDTNDGSYVINSFSTSPGTTVIQDPFPESYLPLFSSLFGVSDLVPGSLDAFSTNLVAPEQHLVLGVSNSFASSLIGQEFGEVFAGYSEDDLVAALQTLSSDDATKQARSDAYDALFGFSDTVYAMGGNFNVTLSEGFSLVAFSEGQAIGTGQSSIIPIASAVPEPESWALMIGGIGLIGGTMRRRAMPARIAFG